MQSTLFSRSNCRLLSAQSDTGKAAGAGSVRGAYGARSIIAIAWHVSAGRRRHLDAAHPLLPIVSLAAGVFLLIAPRIVSYAVAVYLIIVGVLGLNGIYHIFK